MIIGVVLEAALVIAASPVDIRLAAFGMVVAGSVLLALVSIPTYESLRVHNAIFVRRGAKRTVRVIKDFPSEEWADAGDVSTGVGRSADEREHQPPDGAQTASVGTQEPAAASRTLGRAWRPPKGEAQKKVDPGGRSFVRGYTFGEPVRS
jgi:hypothetical protein